MLFPQFYHKILLNGIGFTYIFWGKLLCKMLKSLGGFMELIHKINKGVGEKSC